ncbi:MAG: hypothetical protein KC766_22290 [Myxococcales bacterium]|nr:hypothetical protein [Myxococcales bacterium]
MSQRLESSAPRLLHFRRAKQLLSIGAWLGVGALVVVGCRKKEEVEYPPPNPSASATQTATAPPTSTVPSATATPDAGPPPPPQPVELDPLTLEDMGKLIKKRVFKQAPYPMKAVDKPFGAVLQEGQTYEVPLMVAGGKCYSVIAQGGTGIVELDIEIKLEPIPNLPLPINPTFAVDSTGGPEAAITPCVKNVLPSGIPGKVVLKATRGSGPVAAQVFMK